MDRAEPVGAPNLILGTAGHIDHGKTALCRALTGVDTDRLPEEKRRGITLDLGFAPLDLPDGTRLGMVDVPGHEGLVRTMVAGAAGIDLLLLVVAADEGVMPQTREHVAICRLLGIGEGVVALTKVDLVDDDVAELATEEVRDLLRDTPLADAPVIPVSSTTGEGVERLRAALAERAEIAAARTPRRGPTRLPVDRAFEMRGFGPVATGTLVGGPLAVGENVVLHPGGKRARVRGLQCHGSAVDEALAGVRCAVNLHGVGLEELARGQVVAHADALEPTLTLDARISWLEAAPVVEEPVPVTLLVGTAERLARLAPIGGGALAPGGRGLARLHVDGDPLVVLPGDRFVVRGFSRGPLGATLGGGEVLDAHPPHRRRSDPELIRDLERQGSGDPAEAVAVRVRRAGLAGTTKQVLARQTGLPHDDLEAAIAAAVESRGIHEVGHRVLEAGCLEAIEARLLSRLADYHRAEPLQPGMATSALRGSLPENVPEDLTLHALERLAAAGKLALETDRARLADHAPRLDADEQAACEELARILDDAGLEAPSLRDLASGSGLADAKLRDLLAHLERQGRVVGAPGDLWFDAAAVEDLRERVRSHFENEEVLDTPTYKALIGTPRRTAVPLMELLDAERFTLRRGEVRRLRKS